MNNEMPAAALAQMLEREHWITIGPRQLLALLIETGHIRKTLFGHEVVDAVAMAGVMRTHHGGHWRPMAERYTQNHHSTVVFTPRAAPVVADIIYRQRRAGRAA